MERIIYIIIFAVVVLIFKAMFLDDYLKEKGEVDINTSAEIVETNASVLEHNSTIIENNNTVPIRSNDDFQKKMDDTPLDRFIDNVAEKLDKKL